MQFNSVIGRVGARAALLVFAALLGLTGAARAQDHREEGRGRAEMHRGFVGHDRLAFHEHDVAHFTEVELRGWRGGQWRNTCFGGRCGWWWFAGGQWFFYERPVYPYPLIVSDIAYEDAVVPVYAAPAPVYVAPPPPPRPAALPPQAQMWYYCDSPAGYYPYVQSCPAGFRAVPAQPH